MTTLERLQRARGDISGDVIHLTRSNPELGFSGPRVLAKVLEDGYVKPTFGLRVVGGKWTRTIHGPYEAVCFTEQPLASLHATLEKLGERRYDAYGLVFDKRYVYDWGGRPAIYGDDATCDALPEGLKYLFGLYLPNRRMDDDLRPVDWTHEREWRFRIPEDEEPEYLLPGFPLNLRRNPVAVRGYRSFRILVATNDDADDLERWLDDFTQQPPQVSSPGSRIQKEYELGLANAKTSIISLEEV